MASKYVKAEDLPVSQPTGVASHVQDCVVDDSGLSGAEKLKRRKISGASERTIAEPACIDIEIKNYEQMLIEKEEITDNPLTFWKEHRGTFKMLSQCAREVYSVPASSASSERVFSVGGNVSFIKELKKRFIESFFRSVQIKEASWTKQDIRADVVKYCYEGC